MKNNRTMICVSLYRLFGRYCGRIPAWTLYGSNRTMVVIAHTDDDVTKYGFRAIYQVSYYTPSLKIYWLIVAKNNGHASGFSLKYSYYNFLKIYWLILVKYIIDMLCRL